MSLKLGDVYERAAKKVGKATTALTLTERKVALLNEVLAKGRDLVDQYGISTGGVSTAGAAHWRVA
ncbi:MAG: hypothetical protein IPG34_20125 [Rhodocyclaceae bacterium]|nr:hypothetical protein [Rhodocyclaceae bacterium]